jgi:sensor c-di-GMP phosphodiesterase-like protein
MIMGQEMTSIQYDGSMYVMKPVPELGFTVVAWATLKPLAETWHRQLLLWLPFGILISLLAALFVLRILRRIQSPRNRLLDAINSRDFVVHYQPIVALCSGKIVGAEALTRWPQPDGSSLSPDIFIPLAEQTGLISQLTQLVIEKVFEDMGSWLHLHPDQHISINLAPADLTSGTLPPLLSHLLNKWKVHPGQIALEVTERGFADPKISAPAIAAFRRSGHPVYIDDFGTGYSSLSYLQDLDVDTLKIDKSFVDALEYKNVTPHIIEMAKSLKLAMVAEGVETAGQLAWLHQHGVQYGQGWYYSKALPKTEFILWAENNLGTHAT